MVWSRKGTKSPPLLVLCSFYRQKMSMALQRTHIDSILKQVVTTGEGSSRLVILSGLLPFSLIICFMQLVEVLVFSGSFFSM